MRSSDRGSGPWFVWATGKRKTKCTTREEVVTVVRKFRQAGSSVGDIFIEQVLDEMSQDEILRRTADFM